MKEHYLIYIHLVGYLHDETGIYEFIFSDDPDIIDYENWGWMESPPKDNALPPENGYYNKIVRLELSRFKLKLLSEMNQFFKYFDGYDKIIAIGWEDDEENLELENDVKRLVFYYGDSYDSIANKFYSRDVIFEKK